MNTRQLQRMINLKEREIARIEVKLHEPNSLWKILTLLTKIEVYKEDIRHLESLLQITTNMKKPKKVNKLKKAVTAKSKKALKAKKK